MTRTEIRWVLLPLEVLIGFVLSGIAIGLVVDRLHWWFEPTVGFLVAIIVVCIAYARAPSHRLVAASIAFVLGGAVAYLMLRDYADPRTYEPTLIPFWVTLAGGALALTGAAAHAVLRSRSTSNTSLERTRGE